MFATHKSALIDALAASGAIEVGLHPNFLPGSTHGLDIKSVVAHVCELYPQARCFRSHSFMDGSPIMAEFQARGFKYDSNIVTHFDDGLKPIRHAYDLLRFPVFWEDDVQWHRGETWDLDAYYKRFLTPGLKILNVHPIHFALNTPNERFYRALPKGLNKLPPEEIRRLRHDGPGVRTFVTELVARLRAAGFAISHSGRDIRPQLQSTTIQGEATRCRRNSTGTTGAAMTRRDSEICNNSTKLATQPTLTPRRAITISANWKYPRSSGRCATSRRAIWSISAAATATRSFPSPRIFPAGDSTASTFRKQ